MSNIENLVRKQATETFKKLNPEFFGQSSHQKLVKLPEITNNEPYPIIPTGAREGLGEPISDGIISFILNVCPKSTQFGKRVMVRNGKPVFFSDKGKVEYQKAIEREAMPYAPLKPLEGALELTLRFFLPRPKGLKCDQLSAPWCFKRPDADNLNKGTQDSLSACGFWNDDAQISRLIVEKRYCSTETIPRIFVRIEVL